MSEIEEGGTERERELEGVIERREKKDETNSSNHLSVQYTASMDLAASGLH